MKSDPLQSNMLSPNEQYIKVELNIELNIKIIKIIAKIMINLIYAILYLIKFSSYGILLIKTEQIPIQRV